MEINSDTMNNMNEIKNQNLDAHYSSNPKVPPKERVVAQGPEDIPKYYLFNDIKANIRLGEIDKDIYEDSKKIPAKKKKKKFGLF